MSTNVIREFLVRLGYKVDENGQRRFRENVEKATERVRDLAKAAAVMSTAIGVAVVKVAGDLDNLYFASKRIGASAGNIRSFEFAIKQMGGSGEAARAALEGLARFMRNSPGAEGWLGGLGIKTRDANGNLRDTVEIYKGLADVLQGMDSAQANAVAQVLGVDDVTLQAIRSGDLRKYMADYLATLDKLGIKQDEAAENAAKFSRRLDEVKTVFGLLIEKFAAGIIAAPMGRIWAPEIEALKTLVGWLEKAGEWLTRIGNKLSGGKFGDWLGMATAKVLATFGSKDALAALEGNGDVSRGGKPSAPPASGAASQAGAPGDAKARAMAFFRGLGWSQAQAAGIVANLWSESSLNPGAVGDNGKAFGIAQWHPDRQAAFRVWSGKDIRQSTLQEQLAFVHHELTAGAEQRAGMMLRASTNAQQAGATVSRYYERPLAADAEAAKRGTLAAQIANNTTIVVQGSSDPYATAQAVAQLQSNVAQDTVRTLRPIMQ